MKRLTTILSLIIFSSTLAVSQPCLPEGITLITQAQVDSFHINNPNCTIIEGTVTIGTYGGTDITNLDSLYIVTSIGGDLTIWYNTNLANLVGLNNLTSIGGILRISSNNSLTSLVGLDNLISVGEGITLYANHALTNLIGLDNMNTINESLSILSNHDLLNLTGINNVTSIGWHLKITGNNSLKDLSGLENVMYIGGGLDIYNNDSLTSLTGLENVDTILGNLRIGNIYDGGNLALGSLSPLNNLIYVGGGISICKNFTLSSLDGLDNIDENSIDNLIIRENNSLSACDVQSICDYLASPGGIVEIYDNAPGCNSKSEVEEACGIIAIPKNKFQSEVSVYPNPFEDKITIFHINDSDISNVNIYNQNGQKVMRIEQPQNPIDVSSLPPGLYLIEFTINETRFSMKISKP